jgi:hypothetical protein
VAAPQETLAKGDLGRGNLRGGAPWLARASAPLAQVPGFAILSARLRTLVKQLSVCWSLGPGSQREGQLEKHFRWKSQLQYR